MGARRTGVERWSGGGVGMGCQTAGSIEHALATLKMKRAHCSARTFTRATPRTRAHRAASSNSARAQQQQQQPQVEPARWNRTPHVACGTGGPRPPGKGSGRPRPTEPSDRLAPLRSYHHPPRRSQPSRRQPCRTRPLPRSVDRAQRRRSTRHMHHTNSSDRSSHGKTVPRAACADALAPSPLPPPAALARATPADPSPAGVEGCGHTRWMRVPRGWAGPRRRGGARARGAGRACRRARRQTTAKKKKALKTIEKTEQSDRRGPLPSPLFPPRPLLPRTRAPRT